MQWAHGLSKNAAFKGRLPFCLYNKCPLLKGNLQGELKGRGDFSKRNRTVSVLKISGFIALERHLNSLGHLWESLSAAEMGKNIPVSPTGHTERITVIPISSKTGSAL